MNELKIFENPEHVDPKVWNYCDYEVRTIQKDNEPWWVLSDVCKVLELTNPTVVASRLDDDERSKFNLGRQGSVTIINESGLYNVIIRSDKEQAKQFRKWITSEVLPTIRKTGGYVSDDEAFINTYLPYADEETRSMFRTTLSTVRKQNEIIKQQKAEIIHKEDVIVGLVDEISLAEKRQILNRVVRYNHANYRERWSVLYREFENKYHIDLSRRLAAYNEQNSPKCKNKIDYIDRVLGKIPELYELAAKLYENDVKALVDEMYRVSA